MVVRTMLWNQDPQKAADAPRWRFVSGLDVAVEPAIGEATIAALVSRGHRIGVEPPDASYGFGGAQLIRRIEGGYIAGSDPRKDGCAGGF
jgi:gamma-glutamyltranspeptidase/glutathione hydrolase